MKNEELNMDKVLREKLDGLQEEPPAHIWEGIHEQLILQRGKKDTVFYRWIAVAALLVLAVVAGWYFNKIFYEGMPQTAVIETNGSKEKTTIIEKHGEESGSSTEATDFRLKGSDLQIVAAKHLRSDTDQMKEKIIPETEMTTTIFSTAEQIGCKLLNNLKANLIPGKQVIALAEKAESRVTSGNDVQENLLTDSRISTLSSGAASKSNWKMGLHVSPGYSSYSARHEGNYANNMTYPVQEGNGNVSGGISVQYKTGKRWSLEGGVYYAQNGQRSESSPQSFDLYAGQDNSMTSSEKLYFNPEVDIAGDRMAMNSIAGIIEFKNVPKGAEFAANLERTAGSKNTLLTHGEFSQVFDFIEIPLLLRYLVVDSKIDFELVGGVNAGLVVGNNAFLNNEYGSQNIGKTKDISTVNFSGTMGVGVTYALSKHISLAVEPRLNYYMNSINRNPDVAYRPYRIGVYSGLYYAF